MVAGFSKGCSATDSTSAFTLSADAETGVAGAGASAGVDAGANGETAEAGLPASIFTAPGAGGMSVRRRSLMVFIGTPLLSVGATPIADSSEMRDVLVFAACACAGVRMPSAIMPVLWRIACAGIASCTGLTAAAGSVFFTSAAASGTAAGAGGTPDAGFRTTGFAPPMTGLRITGLLIIGLSFTVEAAGADATADRSTFGGTSPTSSGAIGFISTSSLI